MSIVSAMFNNKIQSFEQAFQAKNITSPQMQEAIRAWFLMYMECPPPDGEDDCQRLPVVIVNKITKTAFSEYEATVQSKGPKAEFMAGLLDKLDKTKKPAMQQALVGGECFVKPVLAPGGFDFAIVRRDCFIPLARDTAGRITDMGTSETTSHEGRYYTLLERRTVDISGALTIQSKLYVSNDPSLIGSEVGLTALPRYARLQPEIVLPGIGNIGMAYVKTPLLNCVDMPKYYEISETAAKQAKDANSFSDYVPSSATAEYRAMVDHAYALGEKQKSQVDPMYHEKIDGLLDRYARKLADNLNSRNAIDADVPSILISGGGNFPTARKEKQNAARDKNMGEYMEIKGLLDKMRSVGRGGISADDGLAVEKLTAKLAGLEQAQELMKTVNAYYRKHETLDGCPSLSPERISEMKESMARGWPMKRAPYPPYALTNNNANIHRVRQRLEELQNRSKFAGWTFHGGEAKINEGENRLQLLFDEKPSEDQRRALKGEGFKWAPSQSAWQRQLNQNAIRAADRLDFLRPKDGGRVRDLQPYAHKTAPDRGER